MLSHYLVSELFAFLLVFCRIGSAIMLLPGFGEAYVLSRARLLIAVFVSMTLAPVLVNLPPVPESVAGLLSVMLPELAVGLFIGFTCRLLIATMSVAGAIIAYQSSLASALTNDITQFQGQDTSLGNLLGMTAVVLLFATNMHHVMLQGLVDSYTLFLPGAFPAVEDMANHLTKLIGGVFAVATQLAAPSIVVGMMLYLGAGILSRLMPNMQIFFILMAPQLLISFSVLMVTFSAIMMWYLDYFGNSISALLGQ